MKKHYLRANAALLTPFSVCDTVLSHFHPYGSSWVLCAVTQLGTTTSKESWLQKAGSEFDLSLLDNRLYQSSSWLFFYHNIAIVSNHVQFIFKMPVILFYQKPCRYRHRYQLLTLFSLAVSKISIFWNEQVRFEVLATLLIYSVKPICLKLAYVRIWFRQEMATQPVQFIRLFGTSVLSPLTKKLGLVS